ncbi:MAG: class I SAM-dependent methyltransferase, partial [Dehalococcoidia bacterium]
MRSVPGARPLVRGFRSGLKQARQEWANVCPFRLPRYIPNTPRIGGSEPLDPFLPPGAETVGAAAMSPEAIEYVLDFVQKLTPSQELTEQLSYYLWSRERFGASWRHADLTTALWAAATLIKPNSYLEIGLRRGRSAALVGSLRPECAIYGFDLWIPDYAGVDNPGPEFVREELRRVGHTGEVVLVSGDSHQTVPAFLRQHPDLFFDVITVDGEKSVPGVADDFANTLPRLKVGGVLIYDDLPFFPTSRRIW